jgi:autotransporter-associated beta strand protein
MGAGKITGSAGIVKSGASTFTLGMDNDYSGTVSIQAGIFKAASTHALGSATGETVVESGGTLDIAGNALNGETISVSGAGASGIGAIINSGADQVNAVARVTLAADTTFGGKGRWDVRGSGASLNTGGNAFNIIKIGTNQVSLVGTTVDPALGDITIQEGVFGIQTTTVSLGGVGDSTKTITVYPNATLELWNLGAASPLNKTIVLRDGATIWNENGVSALDGSVAVQGDDKFNIGGTSLTLNNVVSGSGGLTKTGSGQLILNAANTYTGATVINTGTLALTDTGSIDQSSTITVGTTLDLSQRTTAGLVLATGQTLNGGGNISGDLTISAGSTLAPGNAVGSLNVSGAIILNGNVIIELDKANGANDVLHSGSALGFGGTLTLANSGALATGDSFKIFDAASYNGTFANIIPTSPGGGLTWDTSSLNIDGTIKVSGTSIPQAHITGTILANGSLTITGTGGTAGQGYSVIASSDIALSIANWTAVANGTFNANGSFSIIIPFDSNSAQRFLSVRVP